MSSSDRPNLLIIMPDDHGAWALGCTGTPELSTPTIDGLAAAGTRLDNFYCASPVCSPARASWLTGRIPSAHGVHDWLKLGNLDVPAGVTWSGADRPIEYLAGKPGFTDLLAEAGYVCGFCGKWHMGDSGHAQKGHTWWCTHSLGGDSYVKWFGFEQGDQLLAHDEYVTDYFTDRALSFLGQYGGGERPWCLSLHYTAPHTPWGRNNHPVDLWDKYFALDIASAPHEPPHPWSTKEFAGASPQAHYAGYFAAIEAMDTAIGRVLRRLDEMRLRDDTIVVFVGDNGMNLGHHGVWGKGNGTYPQNMYESSVKVPFIVSWPGHVNAGEVRHGLYTQLDWLPTLVDLLGLRQPEGPLPGRSFAPVLRGEPDHGAEEVVICDEYGPVRMIRDREWKYVHRHPDGPHELYHLADDPDERVNLVDDPAQAQRVTAMRERHREWFDRYRTLELDGLDLPVTGLGQLDRCQAGASAFVPRR